jgi:transportin-3
MSARAYHHREQKHSHQQLAAVAVAAAAAAGLPPHSDDVEEELRRIRLALSAVFSPPPPSAATATVSSPSNASEWFEQRALADRYLTSFQSTAVSWMVCDRLLLLQQQQSAATSSSTSPENAIRSQQERFFAAQTLHTKCRGDVHELPPSALPSLRDSLLNHLRQACTENFAPLKTRLALCLSALAVQMGWTTIVRDLMQHQQQQNQNQQQQAPDTALLLPILRVLPEETASDRLFLEREELRFQMRDHLVESATPVFQFLHALHQQASSSSSSSSHRRRQHQQEEELAFQVFHAWIRYVPVHPTSLVECPLVQASVQVLYSAATERSPATADAYHHHNNNDNNHLEAATDVLVEILRMYPSHHAGNEHLVRLMVPLLSQLPLDHALQLGENEDDENDGGVSAEDVQRAYCRVVTEMGESYLSLILGHRDPDAASRLVRWVLRCSRIPDPDIASITLHFWYRLAADLEVLEPYEWRQELVDAYTPHLLELLDVCVSSLMRYPAEEPPALLMSDDRLDDLNRHRFYVSETVEDCCRLLGGNVVTRRLHGLLRDAIQQAGSAAGEWQGIESCLACLCSIHRFVPGDENELLPACFQLIPRLRGDILPLRSTASRSIGKFASWLALHPQYLPPLLPYLAQGLYASKETAHAAAVAIRELCECSNQSVPIADPVLQLYGEVAGSGCLELQDELQVLQGVCRGKIFLLFDSQPGLDALRAYSIYVLLTFARTVSPAALSRQIQDTREDATSFLTRLVQPIGNRLASSVEDPTSSPRRIVPEIDRFTVIVQHLTISQPPPSSGRNHPMVDLMLSTWPLLDAATNRFGSDSQLSEKVCRFYKHAMRSTGAKDFAPLLDPLVKQLVQSFARTQQSPFLYAASICITEFGNDSRYSALLFEMTKALAGSAFAFLRSFDDMTNHPDVVEELFYLMERIIGNCPVELVRSELLLPLVQCAVAGMRLDHQGGNKGTLKFLDSAITFGLALRERSDPESQAALERVLLQEGRAIVDNLARSMVGELPSYTNQGPEILWKLNLLCPRLVAQWLTSAFDSVPPLPERAKNDFMGALETGLARDEFSLAARALQMACERERRFRRAPEQRRAG